MNQCSVEIYHSFMDLPCWAKHWLIWINQHQVLLSSLIASLAAYVTIKYIRKQISQNKAFRDEDKKKEVQVNVMVFMSEYAEIVSDVLNYYKRIKGCVPNGFTGYIWTKIPYLFELDQENLTFSTISNHLFMEKDGGELLTKLLILKASRNRLAAANKRWNLTKKEGESIFQEASSVDVKTGEIEFKFDASNLHHKRYAVHAQSLLESSMIAAEEQVRDILRLEPMLTKYFRKKLNDQNFEGYIVSEGFVTWFEKNSSDE